MKNVFSLILFLLAGLSACENESERSGENFSAVYTPNSLVGETLVLYDRTGNKLLSVEHLTDKDVLVEGGNVDYRDYPPAYTYKKSSENTAEYQLDITKKTYIPFYQEYHYSKFIFDIVLTFTDDSVGFYTGVRTNGDMSTESINGLFSLSEPGTTPPDVEEPDPEPKPDEYPDIFDCIVSDISERSFMISGEVSVPELSFLSERGFCVGTSPEPVDRIVCDLRCGTVQVLVDDLIPDTRYYVRQYILYKDRILYGKSVVATTLSSFSSEVPGDEYKVDLGLSVRWATANFYVSADGRGHIASSAEYIPSSRKYSTGASEWDLFYWADPSGKQTDKTISYPDRALMPRHISNTDADIVHRKLGGKWRMPTYSECRELVSQCIWKWTNYKGISGMMVTGPNGNHIFLPAAGWGAGVWVYWVGEKCQYWSSDLIVSSNPELSASSFFFDVSGSGYNTIGDLLVHRFCIRPVCD